jgi:hypothetical protein
MLNPNPPYYYQSSSQTHKRGENPQELPESDLQLERELELLENLVLAGINLPFLQLTLINRRRIINQLDLIRSLLPPALTTAIDILQRRQDIIQEAENYSHNLVRAAQEKASQILSESALIRQAELEASKLRYQVQQECEQLQRQTQEKIAHWRELAIAECRDIQTGADDYADAVLDNIEQQLKEMLEVIKNGRQQLEENREN